MDFLKNAMNSVQGNQSANQQQSTSNTGGPAQPGSAHGAQDFSSSNPQQQPSSVGGGGGNFFSGITDKLNTAAGGGRESEKNEDYLDKGVDFVQERFLGQGPQDNETAVEQAKDEQISDYIRGQYKSYTGSEFPIKDRPTRFG